MIDLESMPRYQHQTIEQSISQRDCDREKGLLVEAPPVFKNDEVMATLVSLATSTYFLCFAQENYHFTNKIKV